MQDFIERQIPDYSPTATEAVLAVPILLVAVPVMILVALVALAWGFVNKNLERILWTALIAFMIGSLTVGIIASITAML